MTNSSPSPDTARTPVRRSFKLIALLLSALLALVAGEIFVRFALPEEVDTRILRLIEDNHLHMEGLCYPCDDPDMRYTLRTGRYQEWGTQIAATHPIHPIRISTIHHPPANPAFRIALIGDSTPFGHGVFYENAYASILRSELEQAYAMPIELRNYSLPAYNSTQERAAFERHVIPWKPDLLIYHYDHNDYISTPYSRLTPEFGDNLLHSALLKFATRRLRHLRWNFEGYLFRRRSHDLHRADGKHVSSGDAYERHYKEIHRIGAGAQKSGIPAVALIHDWSLTPHDDPESDPHYRDLHRPLVGQLEAAGFTVLDMYPDYQAIMRENRWNNLHTFSLDKNDLSHPNEVGHALIGRRLAEFITKDPRLHPLLAQASSGAHEKPSPEEYDLLNDYRAGLQAYREKRIEDAERLFRKLHEHDPDRLEYKLNLGRTLSSLERTDEALALFREALQAKHDLPTIHLIVGRILHSRGQIPEAIENHYRYVLDSNAGTQLKQHAAKRLAAAAAALAHDLANRGNPGAAISLLEQSIIALRDRGLTAPIPVLEQLAAKIARTPPKSP